MKRFATVLLCLVLAASALYGCSAEKKTVLTIGQAQVDEEIFAYYFSQAYSQVEAQGGDLLDTAAIIEKAVDLCCEYVSSITLFEKFSLKLVADEKNSVATETEDEWMLYSSYFADSGISKQTINKVKYADVLRTKLLLHYFGEGSEYEVTDEEINYYFNQTYVCFQAINGYLTTIDEMGQTVPLSDTAAAQLRAQFGDKRAKLAAGAKIADVNDGNEVSSTFVAVTDTAYPEGFLAQIAGLDYNVPTVIEIGEYIFLVLRLDAKAADEDYYNTYKTNYIEALRGEMLTDMLVQTGKEYEMTRDDESMNKIADEVIQARNSRK